MTEIIDDNVQVRCLIDDQHWHISEAEVELSQMATPNYVDINAMVPDPETEVPKDLQELRGKDFELFVDTDLESESRSSDSSTLFIGKLANISNIDGYAYECVVYDPSQQVFTGFEDQEIDSSLSSGSILNQRIFINTPLYGWERAYTYEAGTEYEPRVKKASKVIDEIMSFIPSVDEYDNQLTEDGKTVGNKTGAIDREIKFDEINPTIEQALKKIKRETESEFWFDKEGVFHIGLPDPIGHELSLITDTSSGASTPAYQSVRVVGSGIVSESGQNIGHIEPAERIVVEGTIGVDGNNQYTPLLSDQIQSDRLPEPVFTYRSNEINTQAQAKSVARSILEDFGKQEASGKITVTGFPEIEPFDVVVMPQNDDADGINYQPNQGMGGQRYAVYKVVHRINPSDGFKSIIHVSGIVGASKVAVPEEDTPEEDTSDLNPNEPYDPSGQLSAQGAQNLMSGPRDAGIDEPTDSDLPGVDAFDDVDVDDDTSIIDTTEDIGFSVISDYVDEEDEDE